LLSNKLKVIENLDFPKLNMLELGSNKIEKIQNLDKLPVLQELYLGKNLIRKIENLEPLSATLKTLALTVFKFIYG
jgi:protein phosphatase 1 regulatory subunit 7